MGMLRIQLTLALARIDQGADPGDAGIPMRWKDEEYASGHGR